MKINEDLQRKYTTKVTEIKNRPGTWSSLLVEIFCSDKPTLTREDGTSTALPYPVKIGEYTRNYSTLMNTFHPFTQDGKDYALYSPDYTSTRIMSLPDCKDIGGEDRDGFGFCPVDYAVWHDQEVYDEWREVIDSPSDILKKWMERRNIQPENMKTPINGELGFVAGCVWGDDTSWKIQYLDLSKASKGVLKREDWIGYLIKPDDCSLKDAIDMNLWEPDSWRVGIATTKYVDLATKNVLPD